MLVLGDKYGAVALPSVRTSGIPDGATEVRPGWFVSRSLPWPVPQHWKEWIGSIRADRLDKIDLWLVCTGSEGEPEILDGGNRLLQERASRWLYCLTLTDYLVLHGHPVRLTGAYREDAIDVRSIGELSPFHFLFGTPVRAVSLDRLGAAADLSHVLESLPRPEQFSRFSRAVRSFLEGMDAAQPDRRLHLFFRVFESLVLPEPGATRRRIKSRTELFFGPGHHEEVDLWFRMRSAVEHLHPPHELSSLLGLELRERLVEVMRVGFVLEGASRLVLRRILERRRLLEWFSTDEKIAEFWKIPEEGRRELWGAPIDLKGIGELFDPRFIRDHDLGLE